MPWSDDCRCQRERFHVSGDASLTHTHTHTQAYTHTGIHTHAQFKRGYIKRVSHLDDSSDVGSWERVTEKGGGGVTQVKLESRSSAQRR